MEDPFNYQKPKTGKLREEMKMVVVRCESCFDKSRELSNFLQQSTGTAISVTATWGEISW